jgi:hypothetical protein
MFQFALGQRLKITDLREGVGAIVSGSCILGMGLKAQTPVGEFSILNWVRKNTESIQDLELAATSNPEEVLNVEIQRILGALACKVKQEILLLRCMFILLSLYSALLFLRTNDYRNLEKRNVDH